MEISLALHIIALVMWPGGLMILTRVMKLLTVPESSNRLEIAVICKRIFLGFVLPGFLISVGSGVYQIMRNISGIGFEYYKTQGWFHTKLTLVVFLVVITFMTFAQIKKTIAGQTLSRSKVVFLHAGCSSILVAIVFLTLLGR